MGVFNFIETFFFISLGITFVLILLLVYHFKQRLNAIEQKNGTMFDIINNIVQEITTMKKIFLQQSRPNIPMYTRPVHLDSISEFVPSEFVPSEFVPSEFVPSEFVPSDLPSIVQLSDESDSESDSETDSESDAYSTDSDNSSVVSNTKIIVSDDDSIESTDNLHKDNHNIKIINLGTQLFDSTFTTPVVELSSTLPINTNSVLVELDPLEIVFDLVEPVESVDTHIDTHIADTIIANTQVADMQVADSQVADSQADEDDVDDTPVKTIDISTHKSPKEREMAVYNNMSLSELKAKVIEKGLNTEPSKMKRPKLLSMLEKSID